MIEETNPIGVSYIRWAVKGGGNKMPKLYNSKKRAEKAANGMPVVEMRIGEVEHIYLKPMLVDKTSINLINELAEHLNNTDTQIYKFNVSSYGYQPNIIRYTPLGETQVRQKGDGHTDIEVVIKYRINH